MTASHVFRPNWTSAPGDTIADILSERGVSVGEFARSTEQSVEDAQALLEGRESISVALARRLQGFLGGSVEFWMSRDFQYREDTARLHAADFDWLRDLPVGDMIRFGWIRPRPRADGEPEACLRFFGVPSVQAWRREYSALAQVAAFRTSPSFDSTLGAVAAWLRQGEIEASQIDCAPWDAAGFESSLSAVRGLTKVRTPERFLPELQRVCAANGVAVVVVRAPGGCRASGVTRFVSAEKAVLQLSFRYLTDDHFWFTFFHEAAHLLLHQSKLLPDEHGNHWILEGDVGDPSSDEEEANGFAESVLIPAEFRVTLADLPADPKAAIRFAVRAGVSPGIVVGQLQHRGQIGFDQLNWLKRRYAWR